MIAAMDEKIKITPTSFLETLITSFQQKLEAIEVETSIIEKKTKLLDLSNEIVGKELQLEQALRDLVTISPTVIGKEKVWHDRRMPWAGVLTAAKIAIDDLRDDNFTALFNVLKSALERMQGIISYTRIQDKFEPIDIVHVLHSFQDANWSAYIDDAVNPERKFLISLRFSKEAYSRRTLDFVISNGDLLRSFSEPLSNSAKYGATRVTITVAVMNKDFLVVRFEDNGMGIDSERLQRINAALTDDSIVLGGDARVEDGVSTGSGLQSLVGDGLKTIISSKGIGKGTTTLVTFSLKPELSVEL